MYHTFLPKLSWINYYYYYKWPLNRSLQTCITVLMCLVSVESPTALNLDISQVKLRELIESSYPNPLTVDDINKYKNDLATIKALNCDRLTLFF